MGWNRRYGHMEPIIPTGQATLGGMVDHGTRVRSKCRKCGVCMEVDVDMFCASRGRDYSLVDRIEQSLVVGCGGETSFLASPAAGTPFRPVCCKVCHFALTATRSTVFVIVLSVSGTGFLPNGKQQPKETKSAYVVARRVERRGGPSFRRADRPKLCDSQCSSRRPFR